MDGAGNLIVIEKEFTVGGKGDTPGAALDNAFATLRKTAVSKISQSIVYMEPVEVEVVDAALSKWTEKYMMLLWPRERRAYDMTFKVKIMAKVVDLSKVQYREVAPPQGRGDVGNLAKTLLNQGRK